MAHVKSIRIEINPSSYYGGSCDVRKVDIAVTTMDGTLNLTELIPDCDFIRRFDWMIERAKREIAEQVLSGKAESFQ